MRQAVPDDPAVLDTPDAGQQSSEAVDDGRPSAVANARHGDESGGARRTAHPLLSTSAAAKATPTHRSHHQPPPYTNTSAPPKAAASSRPTPTPTFDLLGGDLTDLQPATAPVTATSTGPAPPVPGNRPTAAPSVQTTQRQPELAAVVDTSTTSKPTPNGGTGAGLFDLDFRPPTSATSTSASGFNPTTKNKPPKSSMNDIMSLFSSSSSSPSASASAQQGVSLANGNGVTGGINSNAYAPSSQPQQPQYQSQAIYGPPGSSNAPPTLVAHGNNGQAGYATWSAGANGITSTSPYAAGAGAGTAGLTRGIEAMGLNTLGGGADVWASSSGNGVGQKVKSFLRNHRHLITHAR